METDREAVLKIYPDAYLNEDYSGAPSADVAVFRKATKEDWPNNREVQIGNFCGSNEAAWKSAHSRLLVDALSPHPDLPNQTDSGQNRLGPSPTRSADRARTFPGIARAFAIAVSQLAA